MVSIDPEHMQAHIIPLRQVTEHWNVLKWLEQGPCTNCVKLSNLHASGTGTILIDVEITHPFDPANFTGFDVRGIAMFAGSHEFPAAGHTISDRTMGEGELVSAEGFTSLYNPGTEGAGPGGLQGYMKGKSASATYPNSTLNGYMRYISDDPANTRNAFYSGSTIKRTHEIAMPDGPFIFGYAVDANWAPPLVKPVTDPMTDFGPEANCPEPWKLEVDIFPGLTTSWAPSGVSVYVYDWQGKGTHDSPVLECPELWNSPVITDWAGDGDGFSLYTAGVTNENLAGVGTYKCLVSVEDHENQSSPDWLDLKAYTVTELEVNHLFDPVDVTPLSFAFDGEIIGIDIDEHTAYLADNLDNLILVDITIPESASVLSTAGSDLWMPYGCRVDELNGYTYIAGWQIFDYDYWAYLKVFKSSPYSETQYSTWVPFQEGLAFDVAVGDYTACVTVQGWNGTLPRLEIVDITVPDDAQSASTLLLPSEPYGVAISEQNAFVACGTSGLQIVDISTPDEVGIVKTLELGSSAYDVVAEAGYAYVLDAGSNIHIVDIDPVEASHVVNTVALTGPAQSLCVSKGYAYVAAAGNGFEVVDIDPVWSAHQVCMTDTPGDSLAVRYGKGYLYVADGEAGLRIFKLW